MKWELSRIREEMELGNKKNDDDEGWIFETEEEIQEIEGELEGDKK
jgi:hypothetical protein